MAKEQHAALPIDQAKPTKPIKPIRYYSRETLTFFFKLVRVSGVDNLNRTCFYVIYAFQQILCSCVLEVLGFTISYIKNSAQMDIGTFLTSLQVVINIYIIVPKMYFLYKNMATIRSTLAILDKLDCKIQSEDEVLEAEKMIKYGNIAVGTYLGTYLTYSTLTFLAAIINGHPPFSLYIPFCQWDESTNKLIMASLIEFYLMDLSCIQDAALDVFPVIFTIISRMHMKILSMRVKKIGTDPNLSKDDNLRLLVDCVDTHRKFLRLVETVRPAASKILFCQVSAAVFVTAITLVNLMMFTNLASTLASLCFLAAVTLQSFPICYSMDLLKEEANMLATSAFHCGWFKQSREFRKTLAYFMQNAQQFQPIVAGGFIPIEISTYLTIGKLSFSVYAMVNKIAERRIAQAAKLQAN